MKAALGILFTMVIVSSVLGSEVEMRSFSVNPALPMLEDLRKQGVLYRDRFFTPYWPCGIVTANEIRQYGVAVPQGEKSPGAGTTLPNGATARMEIISEERKDGVWKLRGRLIISDPRFTLDSGFPIFVSSGDGALVKCDRGGPEDPQLVILQIERKER